MSDVLKLTGQVEFQAAAAGKPPRISIIAYNGGVITVPGYGRVILAMDGLTLPDRLPLLADHDASLRGVIGTGRPEIRSGRLVIEGTLATGEAAQRIIELSRDGVPLQASVGVSPGETEAIRPGTSARVNSRTITAGGGGVTLVKSGTLKETSVVVLGADAGTTVHITARGANMGTEIETPAEQPDAIAAERSRIQAIYAAARENNAIGGGDVWAIAERAVAEGTDARDAAVAILRASRPRSPGMVHGRSSHADLDAISAAFLVRSGREALAVEHFGEQATEQARHLRASSFVDLCAAACRLDGISPDGLSRSEVIRASFSSLSLPNALSNVTGKSLLDAYREATTSWRGFAKVLPAADFRGQLTVRPSFTEALAPLPPGGEVKHTVLSEEGTIAWSVAPFARIFRVDRTNVINDDLGFIDQAPTLLGRAAALTLNDLIWRTILGNGGSFFSEAHGNLLAGALATAGLGAAVAAMRAQRDNAGNDVQIVPRVLAVPPELELTGRGLVNSTLLGRVDGEPSGNPLSGLVDVVSESRLSNTSKFANADATAWYLFAGPLDAPVIVGFLDGQQAPRVETFGFESDPNVLALTFRCVHDFGCALGDYRAAIKSVPAPPAG